MHSSKRKRKKEEDLNSIRERERVIMIWLINKEKGYDRM